MLVVIEGYQQIESWAVFGKKDERREGEAAFIARDPEDGTS
jgi:hypothetical protein